MSVCVERERRGSVQETAVCVCARRCLRSAQAARHRTRAAARKVHIEVRRNQRNPGREESRETKSEAKKRRRDAYKREGAKAGIVPVRSVANRRGVQCTQRMVPMCPKT